MDMNNDTDLLSGFAKPKTLSVSDVNAMVRTALEDQPRFVNMSVEGEIGNFTRAASGHLYFSLKDARCQVRCVMWRSKAAQLRFEPEVGTKVLLRGDLTVYEPRGEYQISANSLEPAGIGALQLAFEQLKKKLEAEGLFDPKRKKTIPLLPQRIGIVTSPSGAAIRDVLTVLNRRYPNIHVTIFPSLVQGAEAPAQIAEGIAELDRMGAFDVIIVTRGGGSLEDLWAFNDEGVARAIADSDTPVISAVGHEVDFSIADFVADLRAPTPSAAVEIVVGRKDDFLATLNTYERRMAISLAGQLRHVKAVLRSSDPKRMLASVRRVFERQSQRLDGALQRVGSAMQQRANTSKQRFAAITGELQALSPLNALERGYSIVTQSGEKIPIKAAAELNLGDHLDVRMHDGTAGVVVEKIDSGEEK